MYSVQGYGLTNLMVGPINADHLVRVIILFGVNAVTFALLCPHSSMKTSSSMSNPPRLLR